MTCIPEGISVDAATRAVLEKTYYGNLTPQSTQEEIMAVYDKIDKDFPAESRIITVEYKDIPKNLRDHLRLKEGESIQRYRGLVKRATDDSARAWRKGPEGIDRAIEISSRPDNIIKTEMGTTAHSVLEELGKLNSATKDRSNIMKHDGPTLDIKQIAEMHGLKEVHVKKLGEFMDNLLGRINKIQGKKDSTSKAKLYFERFVPDFTGNLGLTIDLMVLYSDGTTGHFDFKTVYPYMQNRADRWKNDKMQLDKEDWLPDSKFEQIIPQLRTGKDTVLSKNLSHRVEQNRAIPINIQLEFKKYKDQKEGAKLKSEVLYLAAGEGQDPALTMFAVDEMTGIKELDKKIEVMTNNIHNYLKKIQEFNKDYVKRAIYEKKLEAARKFVNKLIVDRDIRTLIDEVQPILRRYYKDFNTLENITDKLNIDGTPNPTYLSNKALMELKQELESYHGVLISSGELIKQIGAHKDNPEQVKEYQAKVSVLAMSMGDAIDMLKREAMSRVFTPEEVDAMQDYSAGSLYQRQWRTFSQQNHPAIAKASDLTQQAYNAARIRRQDLHKQVGDWDIRLDKIGKAKGLKRIDIYKMLVYSRGREKRSLHSKYSGEFWKSVKLAQENKDVPKLKELIRLKDNAEELRAKYRENYIVNYNPTQEELAAWDEKHKFENMFFNRGQSHLYYQENDVAEFYTDGYKVLAQKGNEELLEFWNWWQDKMKDFRYLAGMAEYEALPNNFLPWLTTDVIDMINQGTLDMAGAREWAESLFKLKAYDQHAGVESTREYVNPATGEFLREIPLWFTQPARDSSGNINHDMKSMNLLDSIFIFGDAIYTYHHLKEVEPLMEAIKDVMAMEGEKIQSDYGQDKVLESGQKARKTGRDTKSFKVLDEHINYHMYGHGIQDVSRRVSKFAGQVKKYQMLKELGFAVLSPIGNFLQITTNTWFESLKGYHFTREQLRKARKMITGVESKEAKEKAKAIIYFIEPVDGAVNLQSKSLQLNAVRKFFSMDTAMMGYRMAEHHTENEVLISMFQNYGIDENGNVRRLANLPVGSRSLMDRTTIKDDKLHIDGLMDKDGNVNNELYTTIRNLSVGIARGVKGGKRSQDEVGVNYGLLGNLFMGFKSWMPGMIDERASPIRYAIDTGAIVEGKYTAWLTDTGMSKAYSDGEKTMLGLISEVIIPNTARLMLDVATFGFLFKDGPTSYKVNEQRAKILFDDFKSKYSNDKRVQDMKFEDFLDYKQGQMRSLAAELFVILSLFAFIGYMMGEDDDGESRFRKTWTTRSMFRIANRAKRELSFFINYNDLRGSVLRQPIPQLGLLDNLRTWSINTRDEFGDFAFGEEEERDGFQAVLFGSNKGWAKDKPAFYETFRAMPSHKFFQVFEIFERDSERQY